MKISLLAVGKKMPDWINDGFNEYAKRITGDCKLCLVEIPAIRRSSNINAVTIKAKEAEQIRNRIKKGNLVIVLDERGEHLTTGSFADRLSEWLECGRNISMIIGGADGVEESMRNEANAVISLSGLTLPHGMVRVIIAEQIYRAWSILKNHPYHRE